MECLNCKRIFVKKIGGKGFSNLPKNCPWCLKPVSPRQSNRKTHRSQKRK